jgi:predicted alpha/beta superfamily hydrolase
MYHKTFIIPALFLSASVMAQHTIKIEIRSLPEYHAAGSNIYIAGSFNGWDPQNEEFRFQRDEKQQYFINLKLAPGNYEYKVTRGGWDRGESKKNGAGIANRKLIIERDTTIQLDIEEWQDRFPSKPRTSSASKNVRIIDTAFLIPQLKRTRKVWIYLPEDYSTTGKRYPVLYMHDGQNLFDDATAFAGEWGIDEFMDTTSMRKAIVVGIDHGGQKRINEYSPYDMERFGKGEGKEYTEFLVRTLKPYIDKTYRTLKDRKNTHIAGSSMGGLISMYAALKYPEVFGGAGVFSPAFWVAPRIFDDIKEKGKKVNSKIYFYAGKLEGESMVPDMLKAFEAMVKVSRSKMVSVIRDDGKHNEPTWRKEFPLFYQWLVR